MKMPKIIGCLTGLMCFCLLLVAGSAMAKGPQGVAMGSHNLSTSGGLNGSATEDEICVFCHTPHGGSTDGPL